MAQLSDVSPEEIEAINASIRQQATPQVPKNPVTNSPDKLKMHEELVEKVISGRVPKPDIDYSKMHQIPDIPSKYLYYPEDVSLYGRALEFSELKKLAQMTPNTASTCINDICRCAIKGLPYENILSGDKLYLILWLRAFTYPDSGYSVTFSCPTCDKESTYDFRAENVSINYINEDLDLNTPIELPNGDFLSLKYPTIGDEIKIDRFKNSTKKNTLKYEDDTLALATAIHSINGEEKTLLQKYEYIDQKLKPYDHSHIEGFLSQMSFGIGETLNVKCNGCGGEAVTPLSFRREFFIPPYTTKHVTRNGI